MIGNEWYNPDHSGSGMDQPNRQKPNMSHSSSHKVTRLLLAWQAGDKSALNEMVPLVHSELKRIARRNLRRERAGHTMQTIDLVNEAYLKLVDQQRVDFENRAHFYGICARMMRQILVDYARQKNAGKRGGGAVQVTLDEAVAASDKREIDVLAVDQALTRLAEMDERKCRIAELRYLCGLSVEETAQVLGVSAVTVMREWRLAKAWLSKELG